MTKLEILESIHFDKAHVSLNPYFFGNKYEEKGVLILLKIEKDSDFDYLDIENICFQCPTIESHPDLISMVLFLFNNENIIYLIVQENSHFKYIENVVSGGWIEHGN